MQHCFLLSRKSLRFLESAVGIAIANRKNRCDFGALRRNVNRDLKAKCLFRCMMASENNVCYVTLMSIHRNELKNHVCNAIWKGPKGIPGKGIGKNTLKTPWKILKLPENTWKYPENTPKTPWKILQFMTFSTFSLCPLWVCPLHLSKQWTCHYVNSLFLRECMYVMI